MTKEEKEFKPEEPLSNSRHEAFAQLILKGTSQIDSYRSVYPKSKDWEDGSVSTEAYKLNVDTQISLRIKWLQAQSASSKVITKQRALEILSEIAEADLSDFLTVGADGVTFVDYGKDSLSRKALKKAKTRTTRDENGNIVIETMFNELELEDKVRAMERISKMLGWDQPEKAEVNLTSTDIQQVLKDIAEAGGKWWRRRSTKNGLHK